MGTHTRKQVRRSVQWPVLRPATAGVAIGASPRRGWRGVDQYVKIESDATHPAPPPPSSLNRCPVRLRVSRLNRLICHPRIIFFLAPATQPTFPNPKPYGVRFVTGSLIMGSIGRPLTGYPRHFRSFNWTFQLLDTVYRVSTDLLSHPYFHRGRTFFFNLSTRYYSEFHSIFYNLRVGETPEKHNFRLSIFSEKRLYSIYQAPLRNRNNSDRKKFLRYIRSFRIKRLENLKISKVSIRYSAWVRLDTSKISQPGRRKTRNRRKLMTDMSFSGATKQLDTVENGCG